MTRDQIKIELEQFADELKLSGVTALYMFGSRARGDNKPESDLDLFVDYASDSKVPSYFDLLQARLKFENELGIPVHLGTRLSIDESIRPQVEVDAVRVF